MYSYGPPSYGRAIAGRPARTYMQQLCEDTECSPEDLPEAMNDREKWRERIKDIRASGTTWWWYIHIYIVIYRQTVSLYHNSSAGQDTQDASSCNRNQVDFTSVEYPNPDVSSSQCKRRNFSVYIHIRLIAQFMRSLHLRVWQPVILHSSAQPTTGSIYTPLRKQNPVILGL